MKPIRRNPKISVEQEKILVAMYKMGLMPDANRTKSRFVIAKCIELYGYAISDSIYEIQETLYSLSREWIVGKPMVDASGNLGFYYTSTPEDDEQKWHPAADMDCTEVRLTERAVKYVESRVLCGPTYNELLPLIEKILWIRIQFYLQPEAVNQIVEQCGLSREKANKICQLPIHMLDCRYHNMYTIARIILQ